jgi:cell fate (sporulation/competence/biofilm development) regulator YlbF (YheA/YmcA/DUF963 family)
MNKEEFISDFQSKLISKKFQEMFDEMQISQAVMNLMTKNEQLQAKVNQLETNIAEAIKLLLDNNADYTDGDFEGMRFQNDIVAILERGKER